MYGIETIIPLYPATFMATNKNSPGASCNKCISLAGISKKEIKGLIIKKLKKIQINIEKIEILSKLRAMT
jgi:hypothetical protein